MLGCQIHSAAIYDRGGVVRIGPISDITQVSWSRLRDDVSTASVTVTLPSLDCENLLEATEPNRHELVIFRGTERVWEGVVTLMTYAETSITIEARDVMYYAMRTIDHTGHNNSYPNIVSVVQRAMNLMTDELARKEALDPPINVLPYMIGWVHEDDAQTSKVTDPWQSTIFNDIDNMSARAGLDYTVLGRSVRFWDVHRIPAMGPTLTSDSFIGGVIVSSYGMEHATLAAVTDNQTHYGVFGGVDPYYGEWEILDAAYDEATAGDTEPPSVAEMTRQAERNLNGRNPVPIIVRVPDNSALNPQGMVSIDDLVPGTRFPLIATLAGRTFSQLQKLDSMQVKETPEGETVSVTLSPSAADDTPTEEEA